MGVPWLDTPIQLAWHPSNVCTLNNSAQCEYQLGHWRNWNAADYHYGLPTVALFMTAIGVFAIAHWADEHLPIWLMKSSYMQRIRRVARYLAYRTFRFEGLDWNSAPFGVLLLGVVGVVYFLCMTLVPQPYFWPNTASVDFGDQPPIATRSGWLSIACLPFVFATAGKSNLIAVVTGVSYEKLQIFHRWISYAFFVTALVHMFPFIIYHIKIGDMVEQWNTQIYYWTGVVAIIAQAWLTFASLGPFRNLCYEWFKYSHFVAAVVFMLFLFFHCDGEFSAWDYFVATGVLFSVSWLYRQTRIYLELGFAHQATLTMQSNDLIRVSVPVQMTWTIGQHFFVQFSSFGPHAWTTHPFTSCSLPPRQGVHETREAEVVFYIRQREGVTGRLGRHLSSRPHSTTKVTLDGPYGGVNMRRFESCSQVVVVAGGSGAGWTIPFILAHLRRVDLALSFGRHIELPGLRVILATRDAATKNWYEQMVQSVVSTHAAGKLAECLEIDIFFTGVRPTPEKSTTTTVDTADLESSGGEKQAISRILTTRKETFSVRHHESRPHLASVVRQEVESAGATRRLGFFICGPLSMQGELANATASGQLIMNDGGCSDIYLHIEQFSWA